MLSCLSGNTFANSKSKACQWSNIMYLSAPFKDSHCRRQNEGSIHRRVRTSIRRARIVMILTRFADLCSSTSLILHISCKQNHLTSTNTQSTILQRAVKILTPPNQAKRLKHHYSPRMHHAPFFRRASFMTPLYPCCIPQRGYACRLTPKATDCIPS